jgi:hypothetical protein
LGLGAVAALACAFGTARAQDESLVPDRPAGAARAQELDEAGPRGQMSFTYQNQKTQDLVLSHTTASSPIVRTQLIDVAVSYRIKDRWTIHAGLPVISRESTPTPSHNPLRIVPPRVDSDFVDDGQYHTYLQDLRLGASYLAVDELVSVEPYLEYGIPASNYPFFAASAVGRNLQTIEVGTTLAYRPPFLKWYFSLRAGYQMADKVLGYDIDAMRVTADAAYFISPRLTLNAFLNSKNGKGFDPPATFDMTSELWYRHDQLTRHNYANAGVGLDWSLSDRNVLNFTLIKMVHAEDVFRLQRAMSVSWSRPF